MAYSSRYQYETSPRKLKPEEETTKKTSVKKKYSVSKQKNVKSRQRVKTIMYIIAGFAILFAISYRNSLITASFN